MPMHVLTCVDATALNKWLSLFVMEAKKQNGSPYPSKTIDLLLAGIRRHMKSIDPTLPNLGLETLFHASYEKMVLVPQ